MNDPYSKRYDVKARRALWFYNDFVTKNVSGNTENTVCYNVCASMQRFSPYDVVQVKQVIDEDGNSSQEIEFVELKGREVCFEDFCDYEFEEGKLKELQKVGQQTGNKIYVCAIYYLSDTIFIWEIDPYMEYPTVTKMVNKYTVFKEEGKVPKKMVKFVYPAGQRYEYKFPKELKEQIIKEKEQEEYGRK